MKLLVSALLAAALVCGCQSGTLPDPNDPENVDSVSAETLQSNLRAVSESLMERRVKREITAEQYRELVAKAAAELIDDLKIESVDEAQAWRYGEVLRTARQWKPAETMLRGAVEHAKKTKSEDRRVNDTLRLAHALAEQSKVQEAIATARETLDAKPEDSAPVLPAIFFEIAPAVRRSKEHGIDLAKLLEDAVKVHLATVVDSKSVAGKDFLAARSYHVRNALSLAHALYMEAGRQDLAKAALEKIPPNGTYKL